MKPSEAFMQNREEIAGILKTIGRENVRILGSVIRGEDREDGALDLLAGGNSHIWLHPSGPTRRAARPAMRPETPQVSGARAGGARVAGGSGEILGGSGELPGRMRTASKPRRGVERVRRTTATGPEGAVSVVPSCKKESRPNERYTQGTSEGQGSYIVPSSGVQTRTAHSTVV